MTMRFLGARFARNETIIGNAVHRPARVKEIGPSYDDFTMECAPLMTRDAAHDIRIMGKIKKARSQRQELILKKALQGWTFDTESILKKFTQA